MARRTTCRSVGQLAQRRADEDAEPLVGSADHRRTSRAIGEEAGRAELAAFAVHLVVSVLVHHCSHSLDDLFPQRSYESPDRRRTSGPQRLGGTDESGGIVGVALDEREVGDHFVGVGRRLPIGVALDIGERVLGEVVRPVGVAGREADHHEEHGGLHGEHVVAALDTQHERLGLEVRRRSQITEDVAQHATGAGAEAERPSIVGGTQERLGLAERTIELDHVPAIGGEKGAIERGGPCK